MKQQQNNQKQDEITPKSIIKEELQEQDDNDYELQQNQLGISEMFLRDYAGYSILSREYADFMDDQLLSAYKRIQRELYKQVRMQKLKFIENKENNLNNQKFKNDLKQGIETCLKNYKIQPSQSIDAVLQLGVSSFINKFYEKLRKNIKASQKSQCKQLFTIQLVFVNGQYESFPICFYFRTDKDINEKDFELAEFYAQELAKYKINILHFVYDGNDNIKNYVFKNQLNFVGNRLLNIRKGISYKEGFMDIKERIHCFTSSFILEEIYQRNISNITEVTHDKNRQNREFDLKQIYTKHQELYTEELSKQEIQFTIQEWMPVHLINPSIVIQLYEIYPLYGFYVVCLIPLISQHLKQTRQQVWNSVVLTLEILRFMLRDEIKYYNQQQDNIKNGNPFFTFENDEDKPNNLTQRKLMFSCSNIVMLLNLYLLIKQTIEKNNKTDLDCFNNMTLKREIQYIRTLSDNSCDVQNISQAINNSQFRRYLDIDLCSQYMPEQQNQDKILQGDLEYNQIHDYITGLAKTLYYQATEIHHGGVNGYKITDTLQVIFKITGFDQCKIKYRKLSLQSFAESQEDDENIQDM